MNNEFRTLTTTEIELIAGGFFNPLPDADPVFVNPSAPIPEIDQPIPDPPYWSFGKPGFGFFIIPALGPLPEPALPGKP